MVLLLLTWGYEHDCFLRVEIKLEGFCCSICAPELVPKLETNPEIQIITPTS